ncbi:MAG: MJ1477/TM1410 family putative glycoside hydrolase [Hyphomicrobiaceae bacterium]
MSEGSHATGRTGGIEKMIMTTLVSRRLPGRSGAGALVRAALALAFAVSCLLALAPAARAENITHAELKDLLNQSDNWTYQLQDAKPRDLANTFYDVIVMDAFFGGTKKDIKRLQHMPYGRRRLLLAYFSIGEAETYRDYWKRCCAGSRRPDWIVNENERWRGNYRVKFWNPAWKKILFADPNNNYLKKIVDLGFDGIYLDRIDVYQDFPKGTYADGQTPQAQMVRLVKEIAHAAHRLNPAMLIVAQNAEELASEPDYLTAIDAIAKEDLFYGVDGEGRRNAQGMIDYSVRQLRIAQLAGKRIMVVEYLRNPQVIESVRTKIMELGFVPNFAPRGLEKLQIENLELEDSH